MIAPRHNDPTARRHLRIRSGFTAVGALALAILHGCSGDGTQDERSSVKNDPPVVWFEQLGAAPPISSQDAADLTRRIVVKLSGPGGGDIVPPDLQADRTPRIVFISMSDGLEPARVVMGTGRGIAEAAHDAVARAEALVRTWPLEPPTWFKVDVVMTAEALPDTDPDELDDYVQGVDGLAFGRQTEVALLPDELVCFGLMDDPEEIDWEVIEAWLAQRPERSGLAGPLDPETRRFSYSFRTLSHFSDGTTVLPLYRGHRFFEDLSANELLQAAVQTGRYLTSAVSANGRVVYEYLPRYDKTLDRYNILRHAGAAYSILELYEVTGDPRLLAAAERALDYLATTAQPAPSGDADMACIVEHDEIKLGGNALAIVALAKYVEVTGDRRYWALMQRLARWIPSLQEETGRFSVHKMYHSTGEIDDFRSAYYPGEAILAMMRLHALDGSEVWLDTAERSARYLITVRDKGRADDRLPHDHWLLYALNELYRARPDPLFLEHARRMAMAIVRAQNRAPRYRDWLGSYYRPPRTGPTAIRSEGLVAAHKLLRDFGDPAEAEAVLGAVGLGIRFQLQNQFRPESAMYLQAPPHALGGFRMSLTDYAIRIDNPQHNLSALLGLYRLLIDNGQQAEVPGGPDRPVAVTLDRDTVWSPDDDPIVVASELIVPPGATLTIEPGTTVRFAADTVLGVTGRLVAEGRPDAPIRLVPDDPAAPWRGLRFHKTRQDNRLVWVEMESARSSDRAIMVDESRLLVEHTVWRDIDVNIVETRRPRLILRNCSFPNTGDAEVIDGEGLDTDGWLIIEGNRFARTEGEDVIDQSGGRRPGAILQVLDNVFLGGNDDALDLDATDAHVEGNTFRNFHAGPGVSGTSNVIAADRGAYVVVARNVFVDNDHAMLAKRGARLRVEHNTIVGSGIAAMHFDEAGRGLGPGRGATIVGSILWNNAATFGERPSGMIEIRHCLLPAPWGSDAGHNLDVDPKFVDPPRDLHLGPGSPAIGRGPLGLDLGAYVPGGAQIRGEPVSPAGPSAELVVGGAGLTHYRYRLDDGPWSADVPCGEPIRLANLAPGTHRVFVIGRNSAGAWQTEPTASRPWAVQSAGGGPSAR